MEADAIQQRVMTVGRSSPTERPLAQYGGARPPAPDWYLGLQAIQPELHRPMVGGAAIEVLAWGERGKPTLVLAHGNRAHARWWGPVAPLLARRFRVISLSYSGMGGSDWRSSYTLDQQAAEIFAAAEIAGAFEGKQAPVLIGHSFGARGVTRAMALRGRECAGIILVDSTILPTTLPRIEQPMPDPRYASLADALSRFNLRPPQPCENHYIIDEIARASIAEASDGWRWRFDPAYLAKFVHGDVWSALGAPTCRLAFVYGESSSTVLADVLETQRRHAPVGAPFIAIANAAHHIMIDQPIALAATLSALVQAWHSERVSA